MNPFHNTLHEDIAEILISEESLQKRVRELGREITNAYGGNSILAIGVLKGAAIFLADLVRAIDLPVDYDFVWLSSYGGGTESSGVVEIRKDVEADVSGRHVLVVEDIVDTGWTLRLSRLTESLLARDAASVRVCALLDKPSRRKVDVVIDYRGFEIEDKFVVGYGLDLAGRYRNLPYVGVLKPEIVKRLSGRND
ncbi:MAG: hypoxanthine phosphoribosyltransferase [Armatimonadota bacterium]|nr:hypoxanthine phosphoribosyltransferase [Armatimonadota bacterium]